MKRILVAIVLLLAVACTTHQVTAPPPAAPVTFHGRVLDMDGNPLPGVTVTVQGKGPAITVVSDAGGQYHVKGLAPGSYSIVTELSGFNRTTQRVSLRAEHESLQTTLKLSSVSETITVTAESVIGIPGRAAYYRHFEDHASIETRKERTTTFAIDVDRASYANVRRFLHDGLVPPPDAVRVEEMINYFTYHYPQPEGDVPFSVTTEVAGCPWNANARLLRIGIQGRNLDRWKMAPNNLVFLLDVSGSMDSPDKLPLVMAAFRLLVDQLRAEDRVSVVVYAGAAGLVLPPTSGADKSVILAALGQLSAGGSTAGGKGIELAYKVAQDHFLRDGNNRVILATDGDFNVGLSDFDDLQKLIEDKRKSGIYLSVLGVGDDNLQDSTMEMLADKGNGNYSYLDSLKEAEKVFRNELTGTLVTIAKDVKVQLTFDPSLVASYRQIGYENRALANEDFDDDTKDAGELGAGHSVTALYEFVPASSARGTIATIKLRYKEPGSPTSKLISASAVDQGQNAYDASSDMQFATAIAEFGMLLRDSPHKGTASYADVMHLATISRGEDLEGFREEFLRMLDSAKLVTGPAVAAR